MNFDGDSVKRVDDVVKEGLCMRCGACLGACPENAIVLDQNFFPRVLAGCTNCGICTRVCGGIGIDFKAHARRRGWDSSDLTRDAIGPLLHAYVAYSPDARVRSEGSSGGVVSQTLISLLERGEIDGAVVAGFAEDNPLQPVARIVRSKEGVLACSQSKYTVFPLCQVYSEIKAVPGRYAVVGLPCHMHSLSRWQEICPELRERVVLSIGLCCNSHLDKQCAADLLAIKGISPETVARLEFRGGEWPGGIRVTLRDGSLVPLHAGNIKDGAFNYLNQLYIPPRCKLCIDFSAELADIAVADPWIRDAGGDYRYKGGWTVTMVRSARGHRVISDMLNRKEIIGESVDRSILVASFKPLTLHKKRGAFIRIARRRQSGRPGPDYRLDPPPLSLRDHWKELVYQVGLLPAGSRVLQLLLLRMAFSRWGGEFGRWKGQLKKWKHRLNYKPIR